MLSSTCFVNPSLVTNITRAQISANRKLRRSKSVISVTAKIPTKSGFLLVTFKKCDKLGAKVSQKIRYFSNNKNESFCVGRSFYDGLARFMGLELVQQ